jgi:hypothetical protein
VIGKILIGAVIVGGLALLYLAVYVIIIGYFVAFENTGWTIWWLKLKEIKDKDAVISSKVVIDSKIKSKKKEK